MQPEIREKLHEIKNFVRLTPLGPKNTITSDDPNHYVEDGYDGFTIKKFDENAKLEILEMSDELLVLQTTNVDPGLINTIRRTIQDLVPTMAAHGIVVRQNTSIMPDELLSHRIGLSPLLVDPRNFEFKSEKDLMTPYNTLVFKLKCKGLDEIPEASTKPWLNISTNDLKWVPIGDQLTRFRGMEPHFLPDILLTKLAPEEELDLEIYCEKGTGLEHVKWKPGYSTFKMKPIVKLKHDITDNYTLAESKALIRSCGMKVFAIENDKVVIKKGDNCTVCRTCIERHEEAVELFLDKNVMILTIEAQGGLTAVDILIEALNIIAARATHLAKAVEDLVKQLH